MVTDLQEKTNRYEGMLVDALSRAVRTVLNETHLDAATVDCLEMAESYLDDGRYFKADDGWVNALASFLYGYGRLGVGIRMGLFDIPDNSHLFTT